MDESAAEHGPRFRDERERIYDLVEEVLVQCPSCAGCAVVLPHTGTSGGFMDFRRRLRCGECGFFKDASTRSAVFGGPVDPYLRLPVWLQADCCGHRLWAYGVRHLDLLEAYVGARLRERGARYGPAMPMSLVERLPAWLKAAKNRSEVLKTIKRLRSTLPSEG